MDLTQPVAFGRKPMRPVAELYGLLLAMNVGAWVWAFLAFRHQPLLLSTCMLTYGLGLRHGVDADHIAAIDNVTRKLMGQGQRPLGAGLFFAIGHSSVVVIIAFIIAIAAGAVSHIEQFKHAGGVFATAVSASFLFLIAALNLVVLRSVYGAFVRVKNGEPYVEDDLNALLSGGGLMARIFRPMFRLVDRSWHMVLLGFLFGPGLRHGDRGQPAGHIRGPGVQRIQPIRHPGLSGPVRRRHVPGGHHRRGADGQRLQLGLPQPAPETLLQPHGHPGVGPGGDCHRRGRGARAGGGSVGPARAVLVPGQGGQQPVWALP